MLAVGRWLDLVEIVEIFLNVRRPGTICRKHIYHLSLSSIEPWGLESNSPKLSHVVVVQALLCVFRGRTLRNGSEAFRDRPKPTMAESKRLDGRE